jgi:hypothetical protein
MISEAEAGGFPRFFQPGQLPGVRWQSGDAADCKSAYAGSIPARTSSISRTGDAADFNNKDYFHIQSVLQMNRGTRQTEISRCLLGRAPSSDFAPLQGVTIRVCVGTKGHRHPRVGVSYPFACHLGRPRPSGPSDASCSTETAASSLAEPSLPNSSALFRSPLSAFPRFFRARWIAFRSDCVFSSIHWNLS